MQQRHKKHNHSKPIVPVHKQLGPTAAASKPQHNSQHNSKHKPQQQKQQQQQKPPPPQQQHKQQHKQQQHQVAKKRSLDAPGSGTAPAGAPPPKRHKDAHPAQHAAAGQAPAQQGRPKQQQQQHKQHKHPSQQLQQKQKQKQQQHSAQQPQQQPSVKQQQASNKQLSKKRKQGSSTQGTAMATTPAAAAAVGGAAAADAAVPAAIAAPPRQSAAVGSNWQALQQQLKAAAAEGSKRPFRRKAGGKDAPGGASSGSSSKAGGATAAAAKRQIGSLGRNSALTPVVAMDCEMVGVGPNGDRDSLARVSIVNASGNVLLDTFVAQKEPVVDYRTWVSGVTPQHLIGAPSLEDVQQQVSEMLLGRVVVGHSLNKDLKVLLLSHPRKDIRDTAKFPPFMFSKGGKRRPMALKQLAQQQLGLSIQEGQHSSVDDARAALYLYQKHAVEWERALKTPGGIKQLPTANQAARKRHAVPSYSSKSIADDHMADL